MAAAGVCARACNPLASPSDISHISANSHAHEAALKALWLRALDGDDQAYQQALLNLSGRLRSFFARRLSSLPDDVEDLVQETLLALHLQRATYDAEVPLGAWVFAIARHKLVDLFRRRGRREALHDNFDDLAEHELPSAGNEAQPARRDLSLLLLRLPPAQQQAIAAIKIEGLTMAEASARSGVSVAALKVQVHRGLKRLAQLVRDDAA